MAKQVGQGRTYKTFTIRTSGGMTRVEKIFSLYIAKGNFSSVAFSKLLITQIVETELQPEGLEELRKRYMHIAETIAIMSLAAKDAYNRLWAEETDGDTSEEREARRHLLEAMAKGIKETDKRNLDHKRAALFIKDVQKGMGYKEGML